MILEQFASFYLEIGRAVYLVRASGEIRSATILFYLCLMHLELERIKVYVRLLVGIDRHNG